MGIGGSASISRADQDDSDKQAGSPRQTQWRGRVLRYAEQTEMVERQRAEHLTQDDKRYNGGCAKPRYHQNCDTDEYRAK